MAMQKVEARFQSKDENGNAILDQEGKPVWQGVEVDYDFGDNLDEAIALCGAEVVHSQYVSNAKVALQGIMRAKLKAGNSADAIAEIVRNWKPGMVIEKTQIDPETAIENAYQTWSPEKKAEFLAKLGVQA